MRDVEANLHRLNSQLVIEEEHDFSWLLETQVWGRERFLASLFGLFASLALTLSAAGIYSVVSYTVSQRTRELGVRMALGAQRIGVVRLVLQSSLETVSLGAIAGLALSLLVGKFLATSPHANVRDPAMLLAASGGATPGRRYRLSLSGLKSSIHQPNGGHSHGLGTNHRF